MEFNKPYCDGPYAMVDFLSGGHLFYFTYERVLTFLDHYKIKIEQRIIEDRWMDDFDTGHIEKSKAHLVNYIINDRGHIEFSINDENYIGQNTENDILVFSVRSKNGLTSVCYELKNRSKENSYHSL